MKVLVACLLFVVAVQAVDWKRSARPVYRTFPTLTARPYNNNRIIGGSVASPGQFPYQVALWLDSIYFCGGSLISTTVVLTAGHCGDGTSSFEAHLGAHNVYDESEVGRVIVTSTNGVVHQQYNPNNLHNDIALVLLASPVALSATIGIIPMPTRSQEGDLFEGVLARVSGWGRISDTNPDLSPVLKFVDLTVVPNLDCENTYGNVIISSMICLSTDGGASGSCNGDSGGPLTYQGVQIGIVSFGAAAGCEAGYPLGYTRVTSFLDWLETEGGITILP